MIKRKFGMEYLNISQSRYGSYSHKGLNAYDLTGEDSGIDRFIATYQYVIIGVLSFTGTGFANTVMFYDDENDVTLALTHQNNLDRSIYYVGHRFNLNDTIYFEGMAGKATGNHIHLEIGKGRQTTKTKINGVWQLKELINIEDYFYLDNTIIKDTKGINFEIKELTMNNGLNNIIWNNQRVYVYKQGKDQDIGLISTDNWKETQTIDKFKKDGIEIDCIINASYFENHANSDYGQVYGREQSFSKDERPDQMEWLDTVITKDNEMKIGNFASWEWLKPYVKLGLSHAVTILKDGYSVDDYSSAVGKGKIETKNTQTILGKDKEYFYFIVVAGKLNAYECRELCKKLGIINAVMLDSGGSSQMIADNIKIVYTGRKLPNALVLYKSAKSETTTEETPVTDEIKPIGKINVHRIGMNVRQSLKFNRKKSISSIVGFVEVNGSIELVDFVPGLQTDGFQWVKVKYGKGIAYCQYDSNCYTIEIYK